MERILNTYMEDIDLQFWHDLIQRYGTLVTFDEGEYLCRHGEGSTTFGYVLSGNFHYEIEGTDHKNHVVNSVFSDALVGDYPGCMYDDVSLFDIKAFVRSSAYLMDARILVNLFEQDSYIENQGRLLIEGMFRCLANRYADLVYNNL